jgi:PAS domain S-box-containing protein
VSDPKKSRKQLLEEIAALRGRLEQLEAAEGKWKRSEEALQQSERDKSLILGSLSELITYQDKSLKVVWANKAAGDSVGLSPEELVGRYCYEVWHGRQESCQDCPVQKSLETGRPQEGETSQPDGRAWYIKSFPVMDEDGKVMGAVEITSDITGRKQSEENLRQSEERFRNIFENTTIGIYRTTPDGRILMANPALVQILGFESFDELAKRNLEQEGFEPGYPRSVFKQRIEREGQVTGMEFMWTRRDGTRIFIRENAKRIADKEGNTLYYEGTIEDITKRKQAEEQLQIRDKAIESSISAIAISEPGGNLIYVNSAFLKMWGYNGPDEVIGRSATEFWQFEEQALDVIETLKAKGEWRGELSAKRRDGSPFDVQLLSSMVKRGAGEPDYMMASFLDITERKRTEKTLLASEARYRMVVEDQTELICRFMPKGVLTFVNDAYCRYFDRKREELVGHSFMPLIPEKDRNEVQNQIANLNYENHTVTTEHRVIAQEGSIRWQQWTNRAIFDEQGNIIEYQAVGRDVTESKKTALALENRREFERLITDISRQFINLSPEQIDEGINQALKALGEFAQVDRSYIFQFFNDSRSITNTHEWCAEGITSQIGNLQNLSVDMVPWCMDKLRKFEAIHIPDVAKLPANAKNEKEILQAKETQSLIVIPMVYNRRLVGFVGFDSVRRQRAWSEESIAMLTIVSEIFTNTLMRRRIQQELDLYHEKMFRAEQLASLGTVSATIAHELNQPLTVIQLFLQQGLRALKDDNDVDKVAEVIDDCLGEVAKAASTVDRFRRFARKAAPIYVTEVDLVEVAERVVGLLAGGARRKKLDLSVNVANHPPHIIGNSVELEQMFFVLIQNAIQAADRHRQQEMTITISTQTDHIQLTFADTCGGIKHENMDKIFEPFFTTKPPNISTGLGLCILERIVKRHGGSVRVESQEGHGTIFYIGLPIKN